MAMSRVNLLLLRNLRLVILFVFLTADCHELHQGELCKSTCPDVQKAQRHTYRYSTTIASTLKGPSLGGNQLALDCVVDIDVRPGCPEMILKLRNIQIKHSSSKRDNSVLRLKNIRESLEKNPLRFSLEGGKVTKLCPQEAEQVWTLNIRRSILSMLQTSHSGRVRETVRETDVYGTCLSSYEQRGPTLIKNRNLQQCLSDRISQFWSHSVPLKEGTTVSASLTCVQIYGGTMMNKVNCTEIVSLVPLPGLLEVAETKTISSLTLLRTLEVIPLGSVQNTGTMASLVFEAEVQNPGKLGGSSVEEVTNTVRRLCAHLADQQQQSELLLNLLLQLRSLSSNQLRDLWKEASFKCRDDWQPLSETLSACGSEDCILFTTDLILNKEVEQEQALSLLNTITFASYPTSSMIGHTSALLQDPLIRPKALLVVSSLVHRVCQQKQTPCNEITEVQQFVHALKQTLEAGCVVDDQLEITELLHVLKAVENAGMAVSDLISTLSRCVQDHAVPLELRLAAIRAFRRIPCNEDRKVLAWAFQRQQEHVEVRIASYQQLMHCPNQEIFRIVKTTLSIEKSSQVGSFIWSHLFNIQKTEDPLKKDLMESLPDDIISKDFEAEPWKYSSHMDYTVDTGFAAANMEGAVVFSPESFLPRYAMANLTVHILGRAVNLLEISLRMENLELILRNIFEEHPLAPSDNSRAQDQTDSLTYGQVGKNGDKEQADVSRQGCQSSILSSKFTGQRKKNKTLRCWINVKMFGSDLSFLTCDDLHALRRKLSLSTAAVLVKLLKGQEVKISNRPIVMAEELVLPSLSGLPMKLSINMSTAFSLRLKGTANYKTWSHFSMAGYVKPSALVAISVRAGVDGAFGRVGSEWVTQLKTSSSLDGGVYVHHGQNIKVALNTPEDVMDILTFSSRMFRVSGDTREELIATRNLKEKNTCTPKTWSKMIGWQLCSEISYPLTLRSFPPLGPVAFTLRLHKLDKSLNQYLLEAAYTFVPQRNSWMPLEVTLLLFLGTPQSTIPRDVSLDLNLTPKKLILKLIHPLKNILIQGQLEELHNQHSGRIELLIDNIHHYFIKGLMETVNSASETRAHFHLDAKVMADGHPITLSVNTTHTRSRKITVHALLKNVFNKDASLSVQLERNLEDGQRRYSIDAGILFPSAFGIRALGLLTQKGPEWSSTLRLKFGVQEDSLNMQECHMTQNLHSESDTIQAHRITASHELHCSQFFSLNHKIQFRHEQSPINIQSSLDISYGKQWNQSSNKHRILLNQSLKNQSGPSLTSYAVELSLRLLDKGLNFRTQLLHSHFKRPKSESSTHLKINYNNQMPLVAGLHWKNMSAKASLQNWEGSFNMDTPWLYVYVTQKLTQPQRGISHFSSEITTRKLVNIRTVTLEGLYKDRGKERQGQLHLFTPTVSYIKVSGWSLLGKRGVKGSYSISTAWTPVQHGEISLSNGKNMKTLEISGGCGKHDFNISAVFSTLDKKLKKRLLMMTMSMSDLKNPYVEFQMEGAIEEMRKDRRIYQKRWRLHFRQPFNFIPQSLTLQETFTIALYQKVYSLESKIHVNGNKKAIHILTLGYRPQHPYVCSSLVQSFSTDSIPQNSKICLTLQNKQSVHEVTGQLWTGKEEILSVLGRVQLDITSASQQCITMKANLSQLLESNLPTSVSIDVEALRSHKNTSESEYVSNLTIATDEKNYHAHGVMTVSSTGNISSSISLKEDEKNATLYFTLENTVPYEVNPVDIHVGFHQTLFPGISSDGHIHLAANSSSKSVFLQCTVEQNEGTLSAHLSLEHDPGLRMSLSGDLVNSFSDLAALPNITTVVGVLTQSDGQTEGELTLVMDDAVYGLDLTHQHSSNSRDDPSGNEYALLCVLSMEQSLCVNISSFTQHWCRSLHTRVSHPFTWQHSAGLPFNSTADVYVNWSESSMCVQEELHTGARGPRAALERSSHHKTDTTKHYQVKCTEGIDTDHLSGVCSGPYQGRSLKVGIRVGLSKSESFLFDLQGHHNTSSIGLMVNVSHNVSALEPYLPFEFNSQSQLSHSDSSVKGNAVLLVGITGVTFEGELSSSKSGFKQVLMLKHTIPQLSLPKSMTARTVYDRKGWSYILTHRIQWENQSTQTDPFEDVKQLHHPKLTGGKAHGWGLDLRVESEAQKKLGNLNIDWTVLGIHEQIRAEGSWTLVSRQTETSQHKQPFTSTLSHFHIHAFLHGLAHGYSRNKQAHVSWDHRKPVNVSVTVSKHWHDDSSRGQACILFSPGQLQPVLPLVEMEGCFAVEMEGKAYSQNTELKWKDKRVTQSMKYQGGVKGMHTLLVEMGAQNVSPSPCPSHSLLTQIHTNLRDRLEHHVQLGICPPQPALIWSGSHRVNSGKEILYTNTHLSVSGHHQQNIFTLSLRNISSSQFSNYSLLSEFQVGNWSLELAWSSLFSGRNVGIQVHARLDRSEMIWLQGALEKRCLQAAAGFDNETSDDMRVALCMGGHHWFTLETQRGGRGIEKETLTLISVGAANQSLQIQAKGCRDCLWATEARLQQLGSNIRSKLLDRVQRLHHLLLAFRRQAGDITFLQELSEGPLSLTQRAETLLFRAGGVWSSWTTGPLRHALTHSLPHTLQHLHDMSQQIQLELKKPLATLAGAYLDVTGVRLDTVWQQGMELWTRDLTEFLPSVLHDRHLNMPSQAALQIAIIALDMVSQQTYQWMEARLAAMLVGFRRHLSLMYKFRSDGEVIFRVPLRVGSWLKVKESGVTEVLLEEFVMKPLLALNSLSPTAELYRLKRKIMDSPVNHQAFVVADNYLVSFDGHLLKVPESCDVILAADIIEHSFSVMLKSDRFRRRSLMIQMGNTTIGVHPNGEVEVNCLATHTPYKNTEVNIRKNMNLIEVSNEKGVRVSCDPHLDVCTLILDTWLHGVSVGLLGTNDNEAVNELPLPDGSHTSSVLQFTHSWQVDSKCVSVENEFCENSTADSPSCKSLFLSTNSPLSPCFRVVDPEQFMMACERSKCESVGRADISKSTPCTLAFAFIYLCHRNYVPLELPVQCV
ncbi:uncharacterized protein [Paramisgurnus dabryanus]|uniref:uncharacterized protein n=1 Tax=Paramisgurnus dabryanus TaxID=90735 RepID=UPI0031F34014